MFISFTIAIVLLGTIYGGMLWEVRRLRERVHDQQNQITWCMAVISLIAVQIGMSLPKTPEQWKNERDPSQDAGDL